MERLRTQHEDNDALFHVLHRHHNFGRDDAEGKEINYIGEKKRTDYYLVLHVSLLRL